MTRVPRKQTDRSPRDAHHSPNASVGPGRPEAAGGGGTTAAGTGVRDGCNAGSVPTHSAPRFLNAAGGGSRSPTPGGTLYVFDDTCTHQGCSLAEGDLEGTTVTCIRHGSQFDATDRRRPPRAGRAAGGGAPVLASSATTYRRGGLWAVPAPSWCRVIHSLREQRGRRCRTCGDGAASAIHRPSGEVETLALRSTTARFIAPASLTGGRFGLFQWDMPARAGGASPHFHRTFSESFDVLSGTVRLFDGATWAAARAGDFLYVPEKGGVHGFRNDAEVLDEAASMLILFAPGPPRERYFEELAGIFASGRELSDQEWTELCRSPRPVHGRRVQARASRRTGGPTHG